MARARDRQELGEALDDAQDEGLQDAHGRSGRGRLAESIMGRTLLGLRTVVAGRSS